MFQTISVCRLSSNSISQEEVDIASSCPYCGTAIIPELLYASLVEDFEDDSNNKLFILNFCPNCNECFVSRHSYDESSGTYSFESSTQINFFHIDFSKNIENLFPNFVSIYNESAQAESLGLTSICGMGYRKSLEFLVKDYAISLHQEDSAKISIMPLAQCIDQYIDNSRLKTLAKASAWLGNDETHYVKKHVNYGLNELKAFITATVTYVDAELAVLDAEKLLSS